MYLQIQPTFVESNPSSFCFLAKPKQTFKTKKMKNIFTIAVFFATGVLFAQKNVSVVEVFCNTGDANALQSIPAINAQATIADTSDENHIFIQHHINQTYSNWTDQYAIQASTDRYNSYTNLNIVNSLASIATNGAASTATPWYNCAPIEKDIYSSGAKKVSLQFDSYNSATSTVSVRFVLASKYQSTDTKSIYVYMLESGLTVNVTGGQNSGHTFTMNNVARLVQSEPATVYTDLLQFTLPTGTNTQNVQFVAYVQDDATGEILGGTRGFKLQPYLDAPGSKFAVVEMFCNTGCYGGPPAISSMGTYAATAETNTENQALVELHIYQTYGNWSDVYTLGMNNDRYDKYSWDMGILAGLAAVSKNGIRYTPDSWNSCKPEDKVSTAFVDLSLASYHNNNLIVNYNLSGHLGKHDKVYFYVVESGITVNVTGGEISSTTLNMSNVARVGREKDVDVLSDTVLLQIPTDVNLQNARLLAYIQNDMTYEVTGGTKGLKLNNASSAGLIPVDPNVNFSVYPNPTHTDITLLTSKLQSLKNASVTIYDLNGQVHYTKDLETIPSVLSITDHQLNQGFYFVKIQADEMSLTQKVEIY